MNRKIIGIAVSTLVMILAVFLIGPADAFTHGFFCSEINYEQIPRENILENIRLEDGAYTMQFSPLKPHFAGFEILLANQPKGNTGALVLTVMDENGKKLDVMTADLSKVKNKTWYALYAKASLKPGKLYTLEFTAADCSTYPYLQTVEPGILPQESVSGNILINYAYAEPTFTYQNKLLICLLFLAVWGFICSRLLPEKYQRRSALTAAGIFLTAVLSWNYMYNTMDSQNDKFPEFQADSETLVTSMIYAEQKGIYFSDKAYHGYGLGRYCDVKGKFNTYHLTFITDENCVNGYSTSQPAIILNYNEYTKKAAKPGYYIEFANGSMVEITDTEHIAQQLIIHLEGSSPLTEAQYGSLEHVRFYDADHQLLEPAALIAYRSQYGLQGKIFKWISKFLPDGQAVETLNLLCCIAAAAVFVIIAWLLAQKYNGILAGCFLVTFWLSPWIVNFARNLYWVEFTWFLPMATGIFCAWKIHSRICRILSYLAAFITIALKCLCGYEYISVIMMGLIAFLLTDLACAAFRRDKQMGLLLFRTTVIIGVCALLGFMAAIFIHASLKGNGDILSGINAIISEDVLRRTAGADFNDFAPKYWESFNASIWEVFCTYFHFSTNVITGITGNLFPLICTVPLCIFAYEYKTKNINIELLAMYVIFFLSTVSWFFLAKSHSYVHTHISYVLWYFGFVQICFYIMFNKIAGIFQNIPRNRKEETKN